MVDQLDIPKERLGESADRVLSRSIEEARRRRRVSAGDAGLRVKVATEDWEFRAIHRLNHQAFAEEIPQHAPQASGLLVDRFHDENTYLIALRGEELAGMLAVRATRPFSLDQKLPDLDSYLPPGRRVCELRLLAIAKPHRSGRVLQRLFEALWRYSLSEDFDAAVISGTTRQLKMYRRLGFVPFGPLVGSPGAEFQPMIITREEAAARLGGEGQRAKGKGHNDAKGKGPR